MDTKRDQPHKVTTFQIQWRVKPRFRNSQTSSGDNWTDMEGESWGCSLHYATDRLSYWNKLSIASLLEFRVHQVEMEVK